jgi:hypothetical protein
MAAAPPQASPQRSAAPSASVPASVRLIRAGSGPGLLFALFLTSGCVIGSPTPSPTPLESTRPSDAAVTPTPSGSAAASPSAASPRALGPGTYAKVVVDGLRIRVSAKSDATAVGALFFSDVVRIRADAGVSGGYHWYEIETIQTANDQHLTGYIAGSKGDTKYLEPMSGPPSASPVRSPSSSPSSAPGASSSPSG